MARSPIMQFLMRVRGDHAAAAARGVSVEAIQAARARGEASPGMSRRQFLAAGAAATAAATATLARPGSAHGTPPPRVAIVGGGISGLTAALTLADAGIPATVHEASARVGGRMFSNSVAVNGSSYWENNQVTEWCGELIDTAHVTVQSLAARFGLALTDLVAAEPAGSVSTNYIHGGYYTVDQVNADFARIFPVISAQVAAAVPATTSTGAPNVDGTVLYNAITHEGIRLDNLSLRQWIERHVPGGYASRMGQLLDAAYSSEFGADASDQSCLNMLLMLAYVPTPPLFADFGPSDERYHVAGGNQRIPLAIADHLGPSVVQRGQRLTRIARLANGHYELGFTSGGVETTQVVDYVVLALPFAVLADAVDYTEAGFDARKRMAIEQLGRGLCSKLQLQYTHRPWTHAGVWGPPNNGEEIFSDTQGQCLWEATRGQPGDTGILNSFTGGTPTLQRATTAPVAFGRIGPTGPGARIGEAAEQFNTQVGTVLPGTQSLWNGRATLSLPHLDPNFRLSYAYWKVGQYQQFAGYERAPQGRCFFAGEHTSVNFQGFMEGGAAEGVRAANQVLAAIQGG